MSDIQNFAHGSFKIYCDTHFGDSLWLLGNIEELGKWSMNESIELNSDHYTPSAHLWESPAIKLPLNTTIEYKFYRKSNKGIIEWEKLSNDVNRTLNLNSNESVEIISEFGAIQRQIQSTIENKAEQKYQLSPSFKKFTLVIAEFILGRSISSCHGR